MALPFYTESQIRKILTPRISYRLTHDAFRLMGLGRTQMPPKIYLNAGKGSDFRAMPALVGEATKGAAGIKWISVFPENRSKGLPTVNGTILLSSARDGRLLAILEANTITAMRTGAAAAVAAKYLARPDSKRLAMVGSGLQAEYQLRALAGIFSFAQISVWGFIPDEAQKFCQRFQKEFRGMRPAATIRECVKDADIIVTCTPARQPLVQKEWLRPGCHINAIGADAKGKQELDPAILKTSKVVVDEWEQASHSGEINVPVSRGIFTKKNLYSDLASIVTHKKRGRASAAEITVFDSTGLAILDIQFAHYVHQKLAR